MTYYKNIEVYGETHGVKLPSKVQCEIYETFDGMQKIRLSVNTCVITDLDSMILEGGEFRIGFNNLVNNLVVDLQEIIDGFD